MPADDRYLRDVRALCDERGLLMMLDEIQTGFGRTGEWFGFQHAGVVPDVVTMAKAMGNGFPVGATWAEARGRRGVPARRPRQHLQRHGARDGRRRARSSTRCAASMRRGWPPSAASTFGAARASFPESPSVRGRGLLLAAELADGGDAKAAYSEPARARFGHQRGHADVAAIRPAADRHRGRARRGRRNGRGSSDDEAPPQHHRPLDARSSSQVLHLAERTDLRPVLAGLGVALIFEKPSNRTRQSMEMAVVQLGGHPVYTRGEEVGFDVRETVEDITRVMAGYHAMLAARVFDHSVVERMAAVGTVPIVNMLSDYSHPLQGLADALTMQQVHGPLTGQTVAYVGDYNNVARSLAEACVLLGANVALGCPVGYDAPDAELERLNLLGDGRVGRFIGPPTPSPARSQCTPTRGPRWGKRRRRTIASKRSRATRDRPDDGQGSPECRLLPLPARVPRLRGCRRSDRWSPEPRVPQAHNRMHAARGALAFLMGVR